MGGKLRSDSPDGFFEALGLPEDGVHHSLLEPMAEIILKDEPKLPAVHKTPKAEQQAQMLEDLVPLYVALINTTGMSALGDSKANIPLKEKRLRE